MFRRVTVVEMPVQFVGALEVGQDHGARIPDLEEYCRVAVGTVICEFQCGFAVYFDQEQLRGRAPKDLGGDLVVAARVEFGVRTREEFVGRGAVCPAASMSWLSGLGDEAEGVSSQFRCGFRRVAESVEVAVVNSL